MRKNNSVKNKKPIIIFLCVILVVLAGLIVYLYLNSEDENTSLTVLERQWIQNNKSTLLDVEVINNMEIIGNEGIGVAFDFLKDFEVNTGLEFNRISYSYPNKPTTQTLSIRVLGTNDKLEKSDLVLSWDNYVLIGKSDIKINDKHEINGTIGIIENDSDVISNYAKEIAGVAVKTYKDITTLTTAYNNGEIANFIVPNFIYLDEVTSLETKFVNFQINDIYNMVVIRLGNNNKLNNIVSKYYTKWYSEKSYKAYNNQLFNYFIQNKEVLDKDKASLSARVYRYGYVENIPYNTVSNNILYGIAGEYINMLSSMDNIEFKYIKYDSKESLIKALNSKDVDVAFVDFTFNSSNYNATNSHFKEEVVGITPSYMNVSSIDSLNGYKLYTYKNSFISEYLVNKGYTVNKANDFTKNFEDGILVIDKYQYLFHSNTALSNYKVSFTDHINNNYHFLVQNNSVLLYDLLNFVSEYGNYEVYKNNSLNALGDIIEDTSSFGYIIKTITIFLLGIIAIIIVFRYLNKKNLEKKAIKKEDILKYNDMLTSLKNRNYLNKNMKKWGETKVFPRTIVIVDLNNLKYVNDNYGYEAGNDLIVKAASILINTQLEKSEIIRTDGNEFLIYLLSYSDKQIETYVTKLQKEFDKLPYGFGAAIGYSVINDEIKSIDDAINEATIEMRTNKEQGTKLDNKD